MVTPTSLSLIVTMTLALPAFANEGKPVDPFKNGKSLREYLESSGQSQSRTHFGVGQLNRKSQHVIYRIRYPEEKVFPGIILENGKIAPAIVSHGQRIPACLDRHYKRHPGYWNPQTSRLECNLKQVEMLEFDGDVNEQGTQISAIHMAAVSGQSEMESVLGPGKFQKGVAESSSPHPVIQDSTSAPGSVTARMASGELSEPRGQFSKGKSQHPVEEEIARATSDIQKSYSKGASTGRQYNKQAQQAKARNPNMYVPVTSASAIPVGVTIQEKEDADAFGIPLGTWARVQLKESVNSADKGEAELTLLDSLVGDYQTLPRGTKLFARKRFNNGTEKLDLEVSLALTPEHEEISDIQARVYDSAKREGLNGVVKRLRKEEIKALLSKSTMNALGAVVPQANGVVDGVVSDISEGMIDQESQYLKSIPKATIQVSPQIAWIKISRSF